MSAGASVPPQHPPPGSGADAPPEPDLGVGEINQRIQIVGGGRPHVVGDRGYHRVGVHGGRRYGSAFPGHVRRQAAQTVGGASVRLLDVLLKHDPLHAPLVAAADLDGPQLPAAD